MRRGHKTQKCDIESSCDSGVCRKMDPNNNITNDIKLFAFKLVNFKGLCTNYPCTKRWLPSSLQLKGGKLVNTCIANLNTKSDANLLSSSLCRFLLLACICLADTPPSHIVYCKLTWTLPVMAGFGITMMVPPLPLYKSHYPLHYFFSM